MLSIQEHQLQSDQHKIVGNDPDITDYPVTSQHILYYCTYYSLMITLHSHSHSRVHIHIA